MRGKLLPLRHIDDLLSSKSDEQLINLCAAQHAEALGVLFDRYSKDVYRFAASLMYSHIRDVDDTVQETFLIMFKSAASFKARSQLKTWLFGIATNVARHNARAEKRRRLFGVRYAQVALEPIRPPDHVAICNQQAMQLREAMEHLSHHQRAAFVLCDIEGLCGAEAASALNIPQGTLFRRLHDARTKLIYTLKDQSQ